MFIAVAGVVAASMGNLRSAKLGLVSRFRQEQEQAARENATNFASRLAGIDRDTRFMTDIGARTRRQHGLDEAGQNREIHSAFDALATVVPHYRTIGLFRAHGGASVLAIDPTEDRQRVAGALIDASQELVDHIGPPGTVAVRGPLPIRGRQFLIYADATNDAEVVVVTVDAAMLLSDVLRPARPGSRFVMEDPTGQLWSGCETRAGCQVRQGPGAHRGKAPLAAGELDLPAADVLWTPQALDTPGGRWTLSVVASTDQLEAQETRTMWQVLWTSAGVIAVVLGIGIFMVRQQRAATVLAMRLQTTQELADLRERSDKILENMPVGVVGATRDGRPVFINQFLRSKLALGAGAGTTAASFPPELSAWLAGLGGEFARAQETKQIVAVSSSAHPLTIPALQDCEARVVPLGHPVDAVDNLVLVVDLSDVRALQRQLVRAEKLVTVGVLSSGLAHEIGTPLMVIRGWAEHLVEIEKSPQAMDGLGVIIGEIDRIAATIRRVLDFGNTQPVQRMATDARAALERVIDLLRWKMEKRHLSVAVSSDPAPVMVAADPSQLEQVFVNLLLNACDASTDGGKIEVALGPSPRANFVAIEVSDTGSGIKPENLNAVFDPYFTTKKRGEGTGLGLTVVSQIVRSHSGDVSLQSTLGIGTRVVVNWPAAP
jgi:signal transduction histidine kinase